MTITFKRQLNDQNGDGISGATVEVFEAGETTVVSTHSTDADGIVEIDLPNDGRLFDIKFRFSGVEWWVRGETSGQVEELAVHKVLRLPKYTTTERDAISGLDASDAGFQIWNTTSEQEETWNGSEWVAGGGEMEGDVFDIYDDLTTELTTLAGDDRVPIADVSSSGQPNRWFSLTRLRTWLQSNLVLNASRITAGVFGFNRLPITIHTTQNSYDNAADDDNTLHILVL